MAGRELVFSGIKYSCYSYDSPSFIHWITLTKSHLDSSGCFMRGYGFLRTKASFTEKVKLSLTLSKAGCLKLSFPFLSDSLKSGLLSTYCVMWCVAFVLVQQGTIH